MNAEAVERLWKAGDIKLPRKKVDIPKDMRWNTKWMASRLLEGITQGYSVDRIAESILPEIMKKTVWEGKTKKEQQGLIQRNVNASIRNARTMVTQSECGGRQDSYEELAEQGVVQKKVWIATPDDRTREEHLDLDGEEVDIDEGFSNGCMFPGDPVGDPATVYNCRCSMRDKIIGFRRADGSISRIGHERDYTMHDKQMQEEKNRRREEAEFDAD